MKNSLAIFAFQTHEHFFIAYTAIFYVPCICPAKLKTQTHTQTPDKYNEIVAKTMHDKNVK